MMHGSHTWLVAFALSLVAAVATPSRGSVISPGDLVTSLGVLDRETGAVIHPQIADEADAQGNLYWLETGAVKRLNPVSQQIDTYQLPTTTLRLPDDPAFTVRHVEIAPHPTGGSVFVMADWNPDEGVEMWKLDATDGSVGPFSDTSYYQNYGVYGEAENIALDVQRNVVHSVSETYDDGSVKNIIFAFSVDAVATSVVGCAWPCDLTEVVVAPSGELFGLYTLHTGQSIRSLATSFGADLWTGVAFDIAMDIDGNILIATASDILSLDLDTGETSVLLSGVSVSEFSVVPVPEPSVAALLTLGLAGIAIARRNRPWSPAPRQCV